MTTVFLKNGLSYMPTAAAALDLHDTLPAGNYIVKQHPQTGALFFESIESFPPSGKTYGLTTRHAERIMSTFHSRPASTGVLLNGEKGSGKTLLAKVLAHNAAALGYPTIVINSPLHGDAFNNLIQGLQQPAIVLFDEFEKVYKREEQESILTLLDGVFPSKKLFILTCNDKYRVDEHMRNRPGRIFYLIDFAGLDVQFITEYCEDNLKNTTHIPAICKLSQLFDAFNFDILKALVEEMNRYNESPRDALEILNATPVSDNSTYDLALTVDGKAILIADTYPETISGSPLNSGDNQGVLTVNVIRERGNLDADDEYLFEQSDLKSIDVQTGSFVYENKKAQVTYTRKKISMVDYRKFI